MFNLFSSTPHDPACAAERTGELLLSWETMLLFESIWLADTSQFSRMPHCKTNSFCTFGAFRPTYEWNSLRFWLFLRNSSLIKSKSTVIRCCSTSVLVRDWEGLGLILHYRSTVTICVTAGSTGTCQDPCCFPYPFLLGLALNMRSVFHATYVPVWQGRKVIPLRALWIPL